MAGQNQPYERLATSDNNMPINPPNYDDLNADDTFSQGQSRNTSHVPIEEFEIDDDETFEPLEREGFLVRASLITKKFAYNFNSSVIRPVTKIIDPIYEGYKYFQLQYERSILKLGNPLVVKRLLYVFFVMCFIFIITKYNVSDGVNGASGGAFLSGKFYDINKLSESLKDFIDPRTMKLNLEYLSSMPHIAGSKGDLALSKFIEGHMMNNGINVIDFNELQSFTNYPVFNPKENYVKLSDNSYEATLFERKNHDMEYLAYNPNSLKMNDEIESFYIYANYGTQDDYKKLKDSHIKLNGAIFLVKYGGSIPEPNKIQIAQQHGAKAVVFVTPKYDINGVSYDDVIIKENMGLTRMSPGDVLTPGWPAQDGFVARLPWSKSPITPKIPCIPISWKDASEFIKKLGSNGVKFDDDLYSGTKTDEHKLKIRIQNEERPMHQIWNIVGSIPGREQSEKGVIIGASRDSTCYGTLSSGTGSTVLLEIVKVFTSLQRRYNWSPARTIYFVSFDATEYNLAGSEEWIENKKEELKQQGYAYIDLSDAVSGDELKISSNPFFHSIIKDALAKVDKPDEKESNEHISLFDYYRNINHGNDAIPNNMIEQKNYVPFINTVNIPSMEIKFSGGKYPKNSCYDDFTNFEKSRIDPSMFKHKQLVELLSRIILTLAEEPIIPYNFNDFGLKLGEYVNDLEKFVNDRIATLTQPNIPQIHYEGLRRATDNLKAAGKSFHEWVDNWKKFVAESADIEPSLLAMNRWNWNDNMLIFNSKFLIQDVQPKRSGYTNILFGPAFDAPPADDHKYEWNTFPAIRDYILQNDWGRAQHEMNLMANLISDSAQMFIQPN